MNIKQICSQASATIERFEVELLLSKALNKSRVYLHTHPEKELTVEEWRLFQQYLGRRQLCEPVAYILGSAEFYSLNFLVTPSVLIPRPETELLIDCVLERFRSSTLSVLELGTGSGAIAVVLGTHREAWDITAVDISKEALVIAEANAHLNQVNHIQFRQSNWYENLELLKQKKVDLIVSNPPYIAEEDSHLEALRFEPPLALVAGKEGLDAIHHIIREAKHYLKKGGWIVLEHGYNQKEAVQESLKKCRFVDIQTLEDLNQHPRITIAKQS